MAEPFFFNPNDPDAFDKLKEHVQQVHNEEQKTQMIHEAANMVITEWIDNMTVEELCMLFYYVVRFNPIGNVDSGNIELQVQSLVSQSLGNIEHCLRTRGVNVLYGTDQVLDIILKGK